jgi:hypothetical protein
MCGRCDGETLPGQLVCVQCELEMEGQQERELMEEAEAEFGPPIPEENQMTRTQLCYYFRRFPEYQGIGAAEAEALFTYLSRYASDVAESIRQQLQEENDAKARK